MTFRKHILLCTMILLIGCTEEGSNPVEPEPPVEYDFYPLTIGNRWEFHYTFDRTVRDCLGNDILTPVHLEACSIRRIVSKEIRFRTEYVVQEEMIYSEGGTDTLYVWDRFRQDETGLYRLNLSPNVPPDALPSAEEHWDETLLVYPLEIGAQWFSFADSLQPVTVKSRGIVQIRDNETSGYELDIILNRAGPLDYLTIWYGDCGLVSRVFHTEFDADSNDGTVHFVNHETETLVDVQLIGANGCKITPISN